MNPPSLALLGCTLIRCQLTKFMEPPQTQSTPTWYSALSCRLTLVYILVSLNASSKSDSPPLASLNSSSRLLLVAGNPLPSPEEETSTCQQHPTLSNQPPATFRSTAKTSSLLVTLHFPQLPQAANCQASSHSKIRILRLEGTAFWYWPVHPLPAAACWGSPHPLPPQYYVGSSTSFATSIILPRPGSQLLEQSLLELNQLPQKHRSNGSCRPPLSLE